MRGIFGIVTDREQPLGPILTDAARRLTQEQRIVYLVRDERIDFLQARYHY